MKKAFYFTHTIVTLIDPRGESYINTITGEGLAEALTNTDVVIDLANSPSFEDKAVMDFFETAGKNLLSAGINAGVKQHVALSIVGVDLMQDSGYSPFGRLGKLQNIL